ncbi:MAG: hypothetical protein IJ466_05875 [Clostridia bacterium]|nr:hypothetical protein [Clostridia bacterium]
MSKNVEQSVVKTVAAKTAMNAYEIDHIKGRIYFGRQFMKKANEYGSPEYITFLGLRADFPTYKIEIRDNKKSDIRMSMKGLTRAHMEKYILSLVDGNTNSDKYAEFKKMYAFSKGQLNPYMFLRNWFIKTYPNWDGKEEQRKEARKKRDEAKGFLMLDRIEEEELRNEAAAEEAAKEAEIVSVGASVTDGQQ